MEEVLCNVDITEIICNSHENVFIEKNGQLEALANAFSNKNTYNQFVQNILLELDAEISLKNPFVQGKWRNFRVQIVGSKVHAESTTLNLRRLNSKAWSLEDLRQKGMLTKMQKTYLQKLIHNKKNLLVIGSTGSGKTTLLNALLKETKQEERSVILEDTSELLTPNAASIKLITQSKEGESIQKVDLEDLLKVSLRLRPDRLVVGEVRGHEAKNLVLALSTGHAGSMGTLHAHDAKEAISRLELLIQMGAPQWQSTTLRKLIYYAFDEIIAVERQSSGKRCLKEICRITGLEPSGLLLEPIDLWEKLMP
tara:strand:- start:3734 stop:4663 length:930 start_codon:yes stop_codon:yes gene_type:complete